MIDVVMCAYNSESTIREAVDSVLNQTYRDFKLWVFNDNSQDSTLEILKQYDDERLVILSSSKNIGTYAAKNFALKNVGVGKYLALHDADDISHPERFEKQIRFMEKNDVACLGTAVKEFWEGDWFPHTISIEIVENNERVNKYAKKIKRDELKSVLTHLTNDYDKYIKFKFCMNGTVMFRKSILYKLGGWDGEARVGGDTDLFIRILGEEDIHNLSECLYYRRFHKNSLTANPETGINSSFRKEYNIKRKDVIAASLSGAPVVRDLYYPNDFSCKVITCAV